MIFCGAAINATVVLTFRWSIAAFFVDDGEGAREVLAETANLMPFTTLCAARRVAC